jgi:hypothetical protein
MSIHLTYAQKKTPFSRVLGRRDRKRLPSPGVQTAIHPSALRPCAIFFIEIQTIPDTRIASVI